MYIFHKNQSASKNHETYQNQVLFPPKKHLYNWPCIRPEKNRPLPSQTQEMAFFRVQQEFQAFIHIASKSCQRDLHIGIPTKGWIAPFSTTRNQPEEVCEYCVVSRISHHVNCLLYLLGPVISYAPAGCFVAFFKMFSPGTQAMEGRRQAAAPQGLLL